MAEPTDDYTERSDVISEAALSAKEYYQVEFYDEGSSLISATNGFRRGAKGYVNRGWHHCRS